MHDDFSSTRNSSQQNFSASQTILSTLPVANLNVLLLLQLS